MSRIGKLPVKIPAGVKASVNDNCVSVEGPKGKVSQSFDKNAIKIVLEGDVIHVSPSSNSRFSDAMFGTARSIIAGMVKGASEGFSKVLEIKGVGFKADLKGKVLTLALGYAHPCILDVPEGITIVVGETGDKGKGVRIHGEYVRRKEGKKTA